MHCNTLIEPACHAAGNMFRSVTASAAGDVLSSIAQAISAGVRWIVENTATWWLQIHSPDLAAEPAVARIQQWLLPITVAVAIGGVIAAGARMALTRRANPLLDITGGLLTVAAASTLGVTAMALLLKAGDAWSAWVLQVSTGGHFTQRLMLALNLGGSAAPAVVLIFGTIAIVLSLVQAVLMLFRQAALIILAGALPLAAAGSVAPMTRTWIRKVTAWMLALICYKPAAAAVYAAAFTMIGSGGSPRTMLMGFMMLAMSLVMLPALMKFFTWTTGAIAASGGGGQFLGAATVGAIAVGAMRSGAGGGAAGAQDQAAYINSQFGSPPPNGGSAGGAPSGPGPGSPSGPGGGSPAGSGAGGQHWAGPAGGPSPAASGPASPPSGAGPVGGARPSAGTAPMPAGAATTSGSTAGGSAAGSAGAASGAAGVAATGAGAAVTVAAEGAAQGARLARGAMDLGDQR
jgi:hypothetical protein